jgi:hypothetical protein
MVHTEPSQDSTSTATVVAPLVVVVALVVKPTAVQAVDEVHETPWSSPPTPAGRWGVGRILHFAPSQVSTNVLCTAPAPDRPVHEPTAVQARDEVHDTASSVLNLAPAGLGVGSIVHSEPSNPSAIVTSPVAAR